MSLVVKVCGLRDKQHVTDAVNAGAGALGFVFARSPRQVTPAHAYSICADVPAHVKRVAVMLHPSNEEWLTVLKLFGPDVLQTDAEDFAGLAIPPNVERWPVYREGRTAPDTESTYVYEGSKSGHGETVDWSVAAKLAQRGNMVLAGGLRPDNVAIAVRTVRPYGVDASSGLESAPGQKDAQRISEFINAAKAAEKSL
ncbi:MAG: phosphoribosylanthranilate isomerase [Woeseiaceae bacterium]|jgi:phosphoribosylanthranilate isomerase